jgi:predicted HAD superfamily phosphohydrolase
MGDKMDENIKTVTNEYKYYLEKVCSDYNMSALDVYNTLISKNDADFPLSFETVRDKVLKDVLFDRLEKIFTLLELKSILSDINIKKIKNPQIRKFINNIN